MKNISQKDEVQLKIDSEYKGEKFIQIWMAKTKSIESISRLIKNYNVRWFTLDVENLKFYYGNNLLHDVKFIKTMDLKKIQDVKVIYPNTNLQTRPLEWKYTIILITKERDYYCHAKTEEDRQNLLSGFSAIIRCYKGKQKRLYDDPSCQKLDQFIECENLIQINEDLEKKVDFKDLKGKNDEEIQIKEEEQNIQNSDSNNNLKEIKNQQEQINDEEKQQKISQELKMFQEKKEINDVKITDNKKQCQSEICLEKQESNLIETVFKKQDQQTQDQKYHDLLLETDSKLIPKILENDLKQQEIQQRQKYQINSPKKNLVINETLFNESDKKININTIDIQRQYDDWDDDLDEHQQDDKQYCNNLNYQHYHQKKYDQDLDKDDDDIIPLKQETVDPNIDNDWDVWDAEE